MMKQNNETNMQYSIIILMHITCKCHLIRIVKKYFIFYIYTKVRRKLNVNSSTLVTFVATSHFSDWASTFSRLRSHCKFMQKCAWLEKVTFFEYVTTPREFIWLRKTLWTKILNKSIRIRGQRTLYQRKKQFLGTVMC